MKSADRDHAEGMLDRIGGELRQVWGSLTGHPPSKAKGRFTRGRGAVRRGKGDAKRRAS
jgi:uncharacterized protein YjbJ (UPF0337 family)